MNTTKPTSSHSTKKITGIPPTVTGIVAGGIVVAVVVFGVVVCCLNKRRKLCPNWSLKRPRGSSTTSFEPLTNEESRVSNMPEKNCAKELFSVRDQNGEGKGQPRSRLRHGTLQEPDGGYEGQQSFWNAPQDDYFYDEIFDRSAFVDVTTNRANKDLTLLTENDYFDDENVPDLGDANVPDLVFKASTSRL